MKSLSQHINESFVNEDDISQAKDRLKNYKIKDMSLDDLKKAYDDLSIVWGSDRSPINGKENDIEYQRKDIKGYRKLIFGRYY